ncbi:MAG: phosphatidate cytidylyltransferase [Pirellulales bacterium]|nr:phosphatidate cytidylyltransferase [Pirellulales bacterium]
MSDWNTIALVLIVLTLLAGATIAGQFLSQHPDRGLNPALVRTFNSRIRAYWLLLSILAAAFLGGSGGYGVTFALFGFLSFWALREFITLTPTRLGDHRALFWVFFLFTPLQYLLVSFDQYGLYNVMIPVYAFLFILARVAIAGDYKRYLERTAKIQAGLLICVYSLSYAPAILHLKLGTYDYLGVKSAWEGSNSGLLFFFVVVVQFSDVLQFAWDSLLGKRVIAAHISPNKTWEGLAGGIGSTALLAMSLWWVTPFQPWVAGVMGMLISIMGFAGGITMSAVKRDRGVKDYGTLVVGHGGVLDRIDSICFAAPVFYHLTRAFYQLG